MLNRREWIASTAALLAPAAPAQPDRRLRLWYRQPAGRWIDALPVGNGQLGAMVHGGVEREVIQLNVQGLWAGREHKQDGAKFREALPKVRELLLAGDYDEANALASKTLVGEWDESWYGKYQTLGDLVIETGQAGSTEYVRELDLENGVARVSYRHGAALFQREVFVSRPDAAILIRFSGSAPVNLKLAVQREQCTIRGSERGIEWSGVAPDGGVTWSASCAVHAKGGRVGVNGHALSIQGANEVVLVVRARTSYFNRLDARQPLADPVANYARYHGRHVAAHRAQFSRVALDLGGWEKAAQPTDERVDAIRKGGEDRQLAALYFQYGRYLLMSSSQPGGLPANLQGLWNHLLSPPWQADYHININIPMNYWPAEVANLSECHEPLFTFAEELLSPGARVARDFYGARGSVVHYTTNVWGYAEPGHGLIFGLWQDGLGWLCRHFWQRWEFSADRQFLAKRAWPVIRAAALFYCDLLVENPKTKKLVPGPAASPENTYKTASGKRGWIALGNATANQTVRDVFEMTLAAARELKIEDPAVTEVRDKLSRLAPPVAIGKHGQVMEWPEDFDENEPGHRHVSHLYALHPLTMIDVRKTPEWARAARVTLERRLAAGSGQTGWSAAWMVNFFARLEDGDKAHEILCKLLRQSTEPNLFDTHPSGSGPIFQIDGNFGGCAGIAEMLLQSQSGEVHLLPALPAAWPDGNVRGLRARGGYTVDMTWSQGRLVSAAIKADRPGTLRIRKQKGETLERRHAAGQTIAITGA